MSATARPHLPYALLRPVTRPIPTTDNIVIHVAGDNLDELSDIWEAAELGKVGALTLDLETTGTHPEFGDKVVGISFADDRGAIYVDLREGNPDAWEFILRGLHKSNIPLAAYNVSFDAAFLMRDLRKFGISETGWLNWKYDAYALHRDLAREAFVGQQWGLKYCQVNLLGWELRGDEELAEWLIEHGYKNSAGNAQKGEMHRAPKEILGKYCALDSYSTKELLEFVLLPVAKKFPVVLPYHEAFLDLIRHVCWAQLAGITIDVPRLTYYRADLGQQIERAEAKFRAHPEVSRHLKEYKEYVLKSALEQEPTRYKKRTPPKAPKQKFCKDGSVSKSWVNYEEKLRAFEASTPEETVAYQNWVGKVAGIEAMQPFNLNSGEDKRWLFYDKMGFPVKLTTDSGLPAVDNKALLGFGEAGKLLGDYNDLVKEASYVDACLEKTKVDGLLHPHLKTPGTFTGRLGGSDGLNVQQVPASPGYLSCYVAPEGNSLIILDVAALEPHTLAGTSLDASYMSLYGPGRPANDVYLFVAAQIKNFGEPILACGYAPYNPTKEAVKKAKVECSKLRKIAKVLVLSAGYGAGAMKIWQTLQLSGIDITLEEVKEIYAQFWQLFAGVKSYESFLLAQIDAFGYCLNGIGQPITLANHRLKDVVNACTQSCGHSMFVLYLQLLARNLEKAGIRYRPMIWDLHDAVMLYCPTSQAKECAQIMEDTLRIDTNRILGGQVKLNGSAAIVTNWAADKCEDYKDWLATQPADVQKRLTAPA